MTFKIGLTGGIASGKSTVATMFEAFNVPIIDADKISHALTQPNTLLFQKILKHFGDDILKQDGYLNRQKLREIIFHHATEKNWLENCLHPEIRKEMLEKIKAVKYPYCICVIPLLIESNNIDFINRILVVESSTQMQIERAKTRDHITEEAVNVIIQSQASIAQRRKMAHDIIVNNNDLNFLKNEVLKLHCLYLKLADAVTDAF
ncbi:MAG: dephospho-CoA kinase [uncultured bacterium]|nr:MAG: dephospho-CoA kinase [uncultured bacterium]